MGSDRFSVGRVLSVSARVWARHLAGFVGITALAAAPLLVWGIVTMHWSHDLEALYRMLQWQAALGPVAAFVASTIIASHVVARLDGYAASVRASLGRALPVLGAAIALALVRHGSDQMFMSAVAPGQLSTRTQLLRAAVGVLVQAPFFVAAPVVVLERHNVTGTLARASALVRRHAASFIAIQAANTAVIWGSNRVLAELIGDSEAAWQASTIGLTLLTRSLLATVAAVSYDDLRVEHDGPRPDALAEVFA